MVTALDVAQVADLAIGHYRTYPGMGAAPEAARVLSVAETVTDLAPDLDALYIDLLTVTTVE